MIVVDTNIISETMRLQPEPQVEEWMDSQNTRELFVTSITLAELLAGIAVLPLGKRKAGLESALKLIVAKGFAGRVLPFDERAAEQYAQVIAKSRRIGRTMGIADAQIAAICLANNARLATRNVRDFHDLDLDVINPWEKPDDTTE
jgi:toxin FitB